VNKKGINMKLIQQIKKGDVFNVFEVLRDEDETLKQYTTCEVVSKTDKTLKLRDLNPVGHFVSATNCFASKDDEFLTIKLKKTVRTDKQGRKYTVALKHAFNFTDFGFTVYFGRSGNPTVFLPPNQKYYGAIIYKK
jgi:hypothetical protein